MWGICLSKPLVSLSLFCFCALYPPQPPEPAEKTPVTPRQNTPGPRPRLDRVELQREARQLSDLAITLPADMEHVSHGLLPKDTIDKLKRIEKLSKHLRGEISP